MRFLISFLFVVLAAAIRTDLDSAEWSGSLCKKECHPPFEQCLAEGKTYPEECRKVACRVFKAGCRGCKFCVPLVNAREEAAIHVTEGFGFQVEAEVGNGADMNAKCPNDCLRGRISCKGNRSCLTRYCMTPQCSLCHFCNSTPRKAARDTRDLPEERTSSPHNTV